MTLIGRFWVTPEAGRNVRSFSDAKASKPRTVNFNSASGYTYLAAPLAAQAASAYVISILLPLTDTHVGPRWQNVYNLS